MVARERMGALAYCAISAWRAVAIDTGGTFIGLVVIGGGVLCEGLKTSVFANIERGDMATRPRCLRASACFHHARTA
jgi:hypothetical protein